jgi:hypothetical protein
MTLLLGLAVLVSTVRGEDKSDQPQSFTFRITGLFMPEREPDLHKLFETQPLLELVSVDYEKAEAVIAWDTSKLWRDQQPEKYAELLNNRLRGNSRGAFGARPLSTTPWDKLKQIEIPVAVLDCKACSFAAYEMIFKLPGVERATTSFKTRKVTARIDPEQIDRAALEAALKKGGVELPAVILRELGGSFLNGGEELRIGGEKMGDDQLRFLGRLDPPLKKLQIRGDSKVTSAGLQRIATLTGLEELSISLPDLKDDDVAALAALTGLRKLTLRSDRKEGLSLTPAGLAPLVALTQVEQLGIGGHAFPPAVLATLPEVFPRIKSLDMNHTFSNNADTLRAFARLQHLERIILGGNPWLPEDAMAEVGKMRSLRELNLVHTGEEHFGTAVRSLEGHPNLRRIEMAVRGDQLTDDLAPIFLTIPHLEVFTFGNDPGPLTDAAVEIIARHPKIHTLDLAHPGFSDAVTQKLAGMPALHTLKIGAAHFTDAVLEPLADVQGLRVLEIGNGFRSPVITDAAVAPLARLSRIERISFLLHPNATFSEEALAALKKQLPEAKIELRRKENP